MAGLFKTIGKVFNTFTNVATVADVAVNGFIERQELERDTAYLEAVKDFNDAFTNEDFVKEVTTCNERRAVIAELRNPSKPEPKAK